MRLRTSRCISKYHPEAHAGTAKSIQPSLGMKAVAELVSEATRRTSYWVRQYECVPAK